VMYLPEPEGICGYKNTEKSGYLGEGSMSEKILDDFKKFLLQYRKSWNSMDATRMARHSSKELKARWADPTGVVNDWGYENAKKGWKQAYEMYEGRNPKWYFEDIFVDINAQDEGVAVFWVRFEVDGNMTESKLLFTETFQKENNEWKKIREYVENGFPS